MLSFDKLELLWMILHCGTIFHPFWYVQRIQQLQYHDRAWKLLQITLLELNTVESIWDKTVDKGTNEFHIKTFLNTKLLHCYITDSYRIFTILFDHSGDIVLTPLIFNTTKHSTLTSLSGMFLKFILVILGQCNDLHLRFCSLLNSILWNGNCCTVWRVKTVSQIVFLPDPTLFISCLVQRCSLKQSGHEGKAVLFDVRLSSKGVEDWISTTTGEGKSRGHCSAGFRDKNQPAKTKAAFFIYKCQTNHMME